MAKENDQGDGRFYGVDLGGADRIVIVDRPRPRRLGLRFPSRVAGDG